MFDIEYIKSQVSNIAPKYKIGMVYLFGSYANGTATEDSDVDLRVEDIGRVFFGLVGFIADLIDVFGRVDVLTTKDGLDEDFLYNISQEEMLIL